MLFERATRYFKKIRRDKRNNTVNLFLNVFNQRQEICKERLPWNFDIFSLYIRVNLQIVVLMLDQMFIKIKHIMMITQNTKLSPSVNEHFAFFHIDRYISSLL